MHKLIDQLTAQLSQTQKLMKQSLDTACQSIEVLEDPKHKAFFTDVMDRAQRGEITMEQFSTLIKDFK